MKKNKFMFVNGHTYLTLKYTFLYHIKRFIKWGSILGRMMVGLFVSAHINRFDMPNLSRLIIITCFFCYIIYPFISEVLSLIKFKIDE